MRRILNFFSYLLASFNNKPLTEKDGYYLYVRVYYKKGQIIDFLSYPVHIAQMGFENKLIKKIRPLTEREKKEAIRKGYEK